MTNCNYGILVSALVVLTQIESQAQEQSHQYLMAAMGDSMTAAFLAATKLSWFNHSGRIGDDDFSSPPPTSSAMPLEYRMTYSWATGKKITSQYVLLKTDLLRDDPQAKLIPMNVALSGGETRDLLIQADKIVSKMRTGNFQTLKYVTLLIGNNDACHSMDQDKMRSNIHETFRRLNTIEQSEPIRVLMAGIPRIPDLGKPEISQSHTLFGLTCHELRLNVTHTCNSLTNWKDESEYRASVDYVQGVNETLAESAVEANKDFKNLIVIFSNRLFEQEIASKDLAMDCFHPDTDAQNRISLELWQDQPWFH